VTFERVVRVLNFVGEVALLGLVLLGLFIGAGLLQ
jgi:hypothetical protein